MIAFAVIGAIGLLILIASFVFGELLDAFDLADAGVSSAALGATLTTLGAVGLLSTTNGVPIAAAILIAALIGLVGGGLTQRFIDGLVASDDGHAVYNVMGLEGTLTVDTTATSGEVRLEGPNEVEARLAWSDHPLPAGTRVRVTAQSGSRVRVDPV